MIETVLSVVVLGCLAYLLLTSVFYATLVVVGAFESTVRRHESRSDDFATLATSRFTIRVSVFVAAYNEERVIESTVRSLLALDYPEHEVIVVNDGSSSSSATCARPLDGGWAGGEERVTSEG